MLLRHRIIPKQTALYCSSKDLSHVPCPPMNTVTALFSWIMRYLELYRAWHEHPRVRCWIRLHQLRGMVSDSVLVPLARVYDTRVFNGFIFWNQFPPTGASFRTLTIKVMQWSNSRSHLWWVHNGGNHADHLPEQRRSEICCAFAGVRYS